MIKLLLIYLVSQLSYAGDPTGLGAKTDYNNVFNNKGLCAPIDKNETQPYFESGFCLTILETLKKDACVSKMLEEIRLRMMSDEDQEAQGASEAIKKKNNLELGLKCSSKNDPNNQTFEKVIVKDKEKFAHFMLQFFSLIVTQQSGWQVNHNGNTGNGQGIKCLQKCGLLGLDLKDMNEGADKIAPKENGEVCGCKIGNKIDNHKQEDATMDGHLNLRCGITLALKAVETDKEATNLFGGRQKDPDTGKDTRSGMAKLFKCLEETDAEGKDAPPYDTPLKRIEGKLKNYCDTQAFAASVQKQIMTNPRISDQPSDESGAAKTRK